MSDAPKRSFSIKNLLVLLVLLVVAAAISGYFVPSLPWAPMVQNLFRQGAENMDRSGVYEVAVDNVTLSPHEFKEGENLDIQVIIYRVDAEGNETRIWRSEDFGARRAVVGKTDLTASWSDRPFEMNWTAGESLRVRIFDLAPLLGRDELCVWDIPGGPAFPFSGKHTFEQVKGKNVRAGASNHIVFRSKRVGDLPSP